MHARAPCSGGAKRFFMKFIELTIHTTTEGSELVADILWNYTNYGVAISDVNDVIALQNDKRTFWDYMDDDLCEQAGGDVLVKCFLPLDVADEKIREIVSDLDALRERSAGIFRLGSLETARREVDGDDWIDIWKNISAPYISANGWSSAPNGSDTRKSRTRSSSASIRTWRSARGSMKRLPCASNFCKNTSKRMKRS